MTDNIVSPTRTLSVHNEHEVLLRLETAGLDDELAQVIVGSKDNDIAMKLVRLIRNRGFEATTSQKRARKIMGSNFFGVEEAILHFGVNPAKQQLTALSEIPFSEAVLEETKGTHVLVAVFSLSLLDIRGKVSANNQRLFYDQDWYNKQRFAKDRGSVGWYLIRKTPVDDSTSKSWSEQNNLLSEKDEVPNARVMAYTIIGHYLATGERLFERVYVRTSSVASDGYRVDVGRFDEGGLSVSVSSCGDDFRHDHVGLSSSWKIRAQS